MSGGFHRDFSFLLRQLSGGLFLCPAPRLFFGLLPLFLLTTSSVGRLSFLYHPCGFLDLAASIFFRTSPGRLISSLGVVPGRGPSRFFLW